MKSVFLAALFFVLILILIPLLIGSINTQKSNGIDVNIKISVFLEENNKTIQMSLGDYLIGVVAAEMPANFEFEALKAQAVAARTYVYRRLKVNGGIGCQRHNADICSSSKCCQAFNTKEEMKAKWGTNYSTFYSKISKAISSTQGWILLYDNTPIDPLFHSTCGGHTENSGSVWQKEIAYLKGVECGYCESSPKYYASKKISIANAVQLLANDTNMVLPAANIKANLPKMSISMYTSTNRVAEVKLSNVIYDAVDMRKTLGLNSTWFNFKLAGDYIEFNTKGYGHGVGMCQYGANGMAKKGYKCQEILKKYYSGVEIKKIKVK